MAIKTTSRWIWKVVITGIFLLFLWKIIELRQGSIKYLPTYYTIAYWKQIAFNSVYEVTSDLHTLLEQPVDMNSIAINAKALGINLPSAYKIGVCNEVIILRSHTRRGSSVECQKPLFQYAKTNRHFNKHLALAFDLSYGGFQHDVIAGLPVAAMLLSWVLEYPEERAFICSSVICDILKHSVPSSCIVQLPTAKNAFPISALSLRIAFNEWNKENLTDLSYPLGAYSLASRTPIANLTAHKHVLFLSRGNASNSHRYIDNEVDVIDALRLWSAVNNSSLLVMEHRNPPLWSDNEIRYAFKGASHVIGLHGGSFANLIFSSPKVKVIEINNEAQGDGPNWRRDYFATMALSMGLQYSRLPAPLSMLYRDDEGRRNHFFCSDQMIRDLISLL